MYDKKHNVGEIEVWRKSFFLQIFSHSNMRMGEIHTLTDYFCD